MQAMQSANGNGSHAKGQKTPIVMIGFDKVIDRSLAESRNPGLAHANGKPCTGHDNQKLYQEIINNINYNNALMQGKPISKCIRTYQWQQFLVSFLDYTCSRTNKFDNQIDTLLRLAECCHTKSDDQLYAPITQELSHKLANDVAAGTFKLSFKNMPSFKQLYTAIALDTSKTIITTLSSKQDLESKYAYAYCLLKGIGTPMNGRKALEHFNDIVSHQEFPKEVAEQIMPALIITCESCDFDQNFARLYEIGASHQSPHCTAQLAKKYILHPVQQTDVNKGFALLESATEKGSEEAVKFIQEIMTGSLKFNAKDIFKRGKAFYDFKEKRENEQKFATVKSIMSNNEITKNNTKLAVTLCTEILSCRQTTQAMNVECLQYLECLANKGNAYAAAQAIITLAKAHKFEDLDSFLAKRNLDDKELLHLLSNDNYFEIIKTTCLNGGDRYKALGTSLYAYRFKTAKTTNAIKAAASDAFQFCVLAQEHASLKKNINELVLLIGNHYLKNQNQELAKQFYSIGAANGCPTCMFQLGSIRVANATTLSDTQNGIELLEKAAAMGNISAQLLLIQLYQGCLYKEIGGATTLDQAIKNDSLAYKYADIFLKANQTENTHYKQAQYLVATLLYTQGGSNGIPRDEERAYAFLEQLDQEHYATIDQQYYLFMANTSYKKGDYEKAQYWLKRTPQAQTFLQLMSALLEFTTTGSAKSKEVCTTILNKYFRTVPHDIDLFNKNFFCCSAYDIWTDLIKKLFEKGDDYLKIFAAFIICSIENNNLIDIPVSHAIEYLTNTTNHHNNMAAWCLASLYMDGKKVEKSCEKAEEFLEAIVRRNNIPPAIEDDIYHDLLSIGKQADDLLAMRASYFALPYFIKQGKLSSDAIEQLIKKIEHTIWHLDKPNQELRDLLFTSGLYKALHNAKETFPPFKQVLGVCMFMRYCNEPDTLDLGKTLEACILLDEFVQYARATGNKEEIQNIAVGYKCAAQAWSKVPTCPINFVESFIEKAIALNPQLFIETKKIALHCYELQCKQGNKEEYAPKVDAVLTELVEHGDAFSIIRIIQQELDAASAVPTKQSKLARALRINIDPLLKNALTILINGDYEKACEAFSQVSDKYRLPHWLVLKAYIQFKKLNDHKGALSTIFTAFKRSEERNVQFDTDPASFLMLTNIYNGIKNSGAQTATLYAQLLEKTFEQYKFDRTKKF